MIEDSIRGPEFDFETRFYLLKTEEGGRRTSGIGPGYRCMMKYDDYDSHSGLWTAHFHIDTEDGWLPLGETANVKHKLNCQNPHYGRFYVGKRLTFTESSPFMGRGIVTRIFNPLFEYWDFNTFRADQALGKSYPTDAEIQLRIDNFTEQIHYSNDSIRILYRFNEVKGLQIACLRNVPYVKRKFVDIFGEKIDSHAFFNNLIFNLESLKLKELKYNLRIVTYSENHFNDSLIECLTNFITWNEDQYLFGTIYVVPHYYTLNHIELLFNSEQQTMRK